MQRPEAEEKTQGHEPANQEAAGQEATGRKRGDEDPTKAGRIAWRLTVRDVTPGDVARLRRMDPDLRVEDIWWKVAKDAGLDYANNRLSRVWATVAAMVAEVTKVRDFDTTTLHEGLVPLGEALARAGCSELRFQTLLTADEDAIPSYMAHGVRLMKSRGQTFNMNDAARLMLSEFRTKEERDADRTRIARDYYRTVEA